MRRFQMENRHSISTEQFYKVGRGISSIKGMDKESYSNSNNISIMVMKGEK